MTYNLRHFFTEFQSYQDIRKGADSSFIDWPEKSQNLIRFFSFIADFFHYQTRASLDIK